MQTSLQRLIPSMFHRRLLLLAMGGVLVVAVLAVQLIWLTVAHGQSYRQQAERVLQSRSFIPTARGTIRDRRERVLAVDQPSYDVAVHYSVLTGQWATQRAEARARREHRADWAGLGLVQRMALIAQYQPAYDQQIERLWETLCQQGELDRQELDDRIFAIRSQVQRLAGSVWSRWHTNRSEQMDEPVMLADVTRPIAEQVAHHTLLRDLDDAARLLLVQRITAASQQADSIWQQVRLSDSTARRYPYENVVVTLARDTLPTPLRHDQPARIEVAGVAYHHLGGIREIWEEDYDSRPFLKRLPDGSEDLGGYRPGDLTGSWGIERSQEHVLRGLRGQVIFDRERQVEQRQPPVAGRDVVLSLDIQLQARIQAVMSHDPQIGLMVRQPWHARDLPSPPGSPLNGAAVVLDVSHGQVLAAVSVPGMSSEQLREDSRAIFGDRVNMPYLNRAVAARYVPGSTLKPLILLAADTDARRPQTQTLVCNGHLIPHQADRFRCWIFKQYMQVHGPLQGPRALSESCNVYFYKLGRQLGAHSLVQWLERFGLNQTTGSGLPEEIAGQIPDLARADQPNAAGFSQQDAILMGIGQGPVAWTPLQAANAFATIARRGYAISPTFFKFGNPDHPQQTIDLGLNQRTVDEVMQGLYLAVHDRAGTGHQIRTSAGIEQVFNVPGVTIYGKSGTADPGAVWIDRNHDGIRTPDEVIANPGDHAWFIGMVQREGSSRPDYVVAVVVEFAGSGGSAAGPIANQILWALRSEGYL